MLIFNYLFESYTNKKIIASVDLRLEMKYQGGKATIDHH
ncbi:MAG: hypothetical protein ACJA08_003317 [Cyclobacteriaceae bacterium]|jgi:hypothetical protein